MTRLDVLFVFKHGQMTTHEPLVGTIFTTSSWRMHGGPFTSEYAKGIHPNMYKWDIIGNLTMDVAPYLANMPPNPVHWSVMHINDMWDFLNNANCQESYMKSQSHNTSYMQIDEGSKL